MNADSGIIPPVSERMRGFITAIQLEPAGMFNPWRSGNQDDACGWDEVFRRVLMLRHFDIPMARFILVGEAPGFRGARMTGVAFTSEALVLAGSIPRVSSAWQTLGVLRMSIHKRPWTEPSATVMWKALHEAGVADTTLLWNACPWHPCLPEAPMTNRAPLGLELLAGRPALAELIRLHPAAKVVAVGNVAAAQLKRLGIPVAITARHPAYGGATDFRRALEGLK